jgi:hypothetical protein
MYYVFTAAITEWNKKTLQAEIEEYSGLHLQYQRLWWYGEPLELPTPNFIFTIEENAPKLDNYWTGNLFNLYSDKLVAIFRSINVRFETFEATIIGRNSGKKLPLAYKVFRLLEIEDAIDEERSSYQQFAYKNIDIEEIERLVLNDGFLSTNKPFTRVLRHEHLTIIHHDIKQLLDSQRITGCMYTPIEKYSTLS